MDASRLIKISKYLSRHLRHQPERIGITLQEGGWVEVEILLQACKQNNFVFTRSELEEVVAKNDKKRFSFDATGRLIRANQGHSVTVDLQFQSAIPPDILYHGTGKTTVPLILASGLQKMSRHHVHLSMDIETAKKVGSRHGKPSVLQIDAAQMVADGYIFYCSDNNVWLVDFVDIKYISVLF